MQKIALRFVCPKTFAKMSEVAGGRYCGDCDKIVRDISAMKEADARELLSAPRNERLCIRYLADKSGSIQFADSAPDAPLMPATLLSRAKRAALMVAGVALPMAAAACSADPLHNEEVMGDVAYMPPPDAGSDAGNDAASDAARADAQPEASTDDASPDAGSDPDASDAGPLPN